MSLTIEAIAFDKDGVIFDSEMIYHKTLLQTFDHYGIRVDEVFAAQFRGVSAPKTYEILSNSIADQVNVDEFVSQWMRNKDTYYHQHGLAFIEGIEAVVRALYLEGYPLALVTSDSHENMVEDFGFTQTDLLSCFSATVTLDDVNQAKPNPEPYLRAAALLGVDAQKLLVLEDSDVGATAASDAGANVLVYRPNGNIDKIIEQKVINIIKHPSEMMDYLS